MTDNRLASSQTLFVEDECALEPMPKTGPYNPAHHEPANSLADELTQTEKLAYLGSNVISPPPQVGEAKGKQEEAGEQENKTSESWKEELP